MIFRNNIVSASFIPSLPFVELEKVKVYKTNITTSEQRSYILEVLKHIPQIDDCWVDITDCDNVLRIVGKTQSKQIEEVIDTLGFEIEELN